MKLDLTNTERATLEETEYIIDEQIDSLLDRKNNLLACRPNDYLKEQVTEVSFMLHDLIQLKQLLERISP